jgi:hypothetical protein
MYENAKMISLETIPGIRGGEAVGIKKNDRWGELIYDIFDTCKTCGNSTMYSHSAQ